MIHSFIHAWNLTGKMQKKHKLVEEKKMFSLCLGKLSFCENMVMSLPDPLEGHGSCQKTINNAKDCKNNYKDDS